MPHERLMCSHRTNSKTTKKRLVSYSCITLPFFLKRNVIWHFENNLISVQNIFVYKHSGDSNYMQSTPMYRLWDTHYIMMCMASILWDIYHLHYLHSVRHISPALSPFCETYITCITSILWDTYHLHYLHSVRHISPALSPFCETHITCIISILCWLHFVKSWYSSLSSTNMNNNHLPKIIFNWDYSCRGNTWSSNIKSILMTLIAKTSLFLNHRFVWTVVGHSYMNYNG